MSNYKSDALMLADYLEESLLDANEQRIVEELRRLHARNQELEAMLDAVGAGGVSAQRVTQAKDHIAQDRKMVAAQETNRLLARIEKEISTAQINNHRMAAPFGKMEGEPCVRISSLLATIEGFLNEATDEQAAAQEPFGYFKAEPFGWRDCAETDEGALALYDAPQPQADARAAERVDALYKALEVCSAELFAQCAHQGRAMKYVEQARKALAAEQCARAANAAANVAAKGMK